MYRIYWTKTYQRWISIKHRFFRGIVYTQKGWKKSLQKDVYKRICKKFSYSCGPFCFSLNRAIKNDGKSEDSISITLFLYSDYLTYIYMKKVVTCYRMHRRCFVFLYHFVCSTMHRLTITRETGFTDSLLCTKCV